MSLFSSVWNGAANEIGGIRRSGFAKSALQWFGKDVSAATARGKALSFQPMLKDAYRRSGWAAYGLMGLGAGAGIGAGYGYMNGDTFGGMRRGMLYGGLGGVGYGGFRGLRASAMSRSRGSIGWQMAAVRARGERGAAVKDLRSLRLAGRGGWPGAAGGI